ncbi:MAG TPA: methyltransferase domain-containing protein [Polyangiaceae bacterium]|jgi:SAM-dependent methyltransferase|nr:methyltransferase domain-containing protein [Polyangiaceae bacterium]
MTLERASEVDKFDRYAQSYREAHAASIQASGEGPEYFARHKLQCLARMGLSRGQRVLDYGCGTGSLTRLLLERCDSVCGYDPSARSLEQARQVAAGASYYADEREIPAGIFDLVVLSGVLHHVPPAERARVLETVASKLRLGGRVVIFEHNPYNPLTVKAVQDCPFDDDAILLPPSELRRLLHGARLGSVRQDFVLFFPRALRLLRPLEPWLRWLPVGAQTLTSATRVA